MVKTSIDFERTSVIEGIKIFKVRKFRWIGTEFFL